MSDNPILTKTFYAGAAVEPYRIVKFGADDDHVIQAAAATDLMFGVTTELGGGAEDRLDVVTVGEAEVEYGGNVTRGQLLTSDGDGKAVAWGPAQGANAAYIGRARVSGVDGDIGKVCICPGEAQGE